MMRMTYKRVLAMSPWLDDNGLCAYDPRKPRPLRLQDQKYLRQEVAIALRWLRSCCEPLKGPKRTRSSYGLKHDAEVWACSYVRNAALIVAALMLGYTATPCDDTSPNAYFNVRQRATTRIRDRHDRSGVVHQTRKNVSSRTNGYETLCGVKHGGGTPYIAMAPNARVTCLECVAAAEGD